MLNKSDLNEIEHDEVKFDENMELSSIRKVAK